jgi:predicted Zn-dependent protease
MKKLAVLSIILFFFTKTMASFEEGTVIRDAEIEEILRSYIEPLFEKAHLDKKDLNLVLLINKEVNAAATVNTTLILNSGFLLHTTNLNEVLGVLAHEVGHLEGRHIIRMIEALDQTKKSNVLSIAAGLALGLLTQRPDLGAAVAAGSSISSVYSLLSYNRAEEASADQAAIKYLNALCWPSEGMASFFEKLLGQELLSSNLQDPYTRSHPLTKDRLETVKAQLKTTCQQPLPPRMIENYHILKTKLEAFLLPPESVLQKNRGNSSLEKYAQAIAYYRQGKINMAISTLDSLISKSPQNPYYYELKGQIYYENGKISLAITHYKKAISLKPKEVLFQMGLAQSLIALNTTPSLQEAGKLLEEAQQKEPTNITIWQLLSIVYGRLNKMGAMALALAEKAALLRKWNEADEQVTRALHHLDKKDPLYLHAEDLQLQTKREKNTITQTSTL